MIIILNGKEKQLGHYTRLTHGEIVMLAFGPGYSEDTVFTLTYWRPRHSRMPLGMKPSGGSVVQGEDVKITSRMVINCTQTGKA